MPLMRPPALAGLKWNGSPVGPEVTVNVSVHDVEPLTAEGWILVGDLAGDVPAGTELVTEKDEE